MKKLILFTGLPGSGKSTLSKRYCENHNAVWLSVDPIEGALKLEGITGYQLGVLSYNICKTIADDNLSMNKQVVIDAVNPVEEARQIWRDLAKKHQTHLNIVECVVPDEATHKKRIETRVRNIPGYSEITWDRVQERKKEYTPWNDERLLVLTDKSIDDSAKEVEAYLN
jgi:predicted kinase